MDVAVVVGILYFSFYFTFLVLLSIDLCIVNLILYTLCCSFIYRLRSKNIYTEHYTVFIFIKLLHLLRRNQKERKKLKNKGVSKEIAPEFAFSNLLSHFSSSFQLSVVTRTFLFFFYKPQFMISNVCRLFSIQQTIFFPFTTFMKI